MFKCLMFYGIRLLKPIAHKSMMIGRLRRINNETEAGNLKAPFENPSESDVEDDEFC